MKTITDQQRAKMMLETRAHPFSVDSFYRRNAKRYLFQVAIFIPVLALYAYLQVWPLLCLTSGFVIGIFVRDYSWALIITRGWPFNLKVIDWDKVQKIADGQTVDSVP